MDTRLTSPLSLVESVVLAIAPDERAAAVAKATSVEQQRRLAALALDAEYSFAAASGQDADPQPNNANARDANTVALPSARSLLLRQALAARSSGSSSSSSGPSNVVAAARALFGDADSNTAIRWTSEDTDAHSEYSDHADHADHAAVAENNNSDFAADAARLAATQDAARAEPSQWAALAKKTAASLGAGPNAADSAAYAAGRDLLARLAHGAQLLDAEGCDQLPGLFHKVYSFLPLPSPDTFSLLTLEQMDAIAAFNKEYWFKNQYYVDAYLKKLAASLIHSHSSLNGSPSPIPANLDALVQMDLFCNKNLAESGGLMDLVKANIVFRILKFQLDCLKRFDVACFERYIRMPRWGTFNEVWTSKTFTQSTNSMEMPQWNTPRWEDRALVDQFLEHIFKTDVTKTIESYSDWIHLHIVQEKFAFVKICHSDEGEKWHHLVGPSQLQTLLTSIVLLFEPESRPEFLAPIAGSKTVLPLSLQNVSSFEVNEYEINTFALYSSNSDSAVFDSTYTIMGLDLSGVVPHRSSVVKVDGVRPGRYFRHNVEVPSFDQVERGIVVVEVVGAGKRCRAVLKKGLFRVIEDITINGHVFSVVDEKNVKIDSMYNVFMAGHTFEPRADGTFLIPFTKNSKTETLLITHKGYTFPARFNHCTEEYTLDTKWLYNREAIRSGNTITVAVCPTVRLTDRNVLVKLRDLVPSSTSSSGGDGGGPIKALISIKIVAADGLESVKLLEGVNVYDDAEITFDLNIPAKVKSIEFKLTLSIRNVSKKEDQILENVNYVEVNCIDNSTTIEAAFLKKDEENGYQMLVLGKNGEPRKKYNVNVSFKHEGIEPLINRSLVTNDTGVIELGRLQGITGVGVTIGDTPAKVWDISGISSLNNISTPQALVTVEETQQLVLPLNVSADRMTSFPGLWNFVRVDSPQLIISSARNHVSFRPIGKTSCELVISEGLKEGLYTFSWQFTKSSRHSFQIKVSPSTNVSNAATSEQPVPGIRKEFNAGSQFEFDLFPKTKPQKLNPARIVDVSQNKRGFDIKLANQTPTTRVHCIVSLFARADMSIDEFVDFSADRSTIPADEVSRLDPNTLACGYSLPQSLNPDLEYVLKRRRDFEEKGGIVGNTLKKPMAVLDSWESRKTSLLDTNLDGAVQKESYHLDGMQKQQQQQQQMYLSQQPPAPYAAAPIAAYSYSPTSPSYSPTSTSYGTMSGGLREIKKKRAASKPLPPKLEQLIMYRFDQTNYDFLARNGPSLFNLKPSDNGSLFIPFSETLKCEVAFVVVDESSRTLLKLQVNNESRNEPIPRTETSVRPNWSITTPISEILSNSALHSAGETLTVSLGSDYAVLSDLPKLYSIAESLGSPSAKTPLSQFRFITTWNTLSPASKAARYSQYSCHELNCFLYFKDPAFFASVVKPHVSSKSCKSFMDQVLLGNVGYCKSALKDGVVWEKLNLVEKLLFAKLVQSTGGDGDEAGVVSKWVANAYKMVCKNGPYMAAKSVKRERLFQLLRNSEKDKPEPPTRRSMRVRRERGADSDDDTDGFCVEEQEGGEYEGSAGFRSADMRFMDTRAVEIAPKAKFFEPPPATSELAERHYWNRLRWQNEKGIEINDFWRDFFKSGESNFVSENIEDVLVGGDFTEIMLALAVLGIGFSSVTTNAFETQKVDEVSLAIKSNVPSIVYHKEFKESETKSLQSIICNVQFYDPDNSEVQDEDSLEWIPQYINPQNGHKFLAGKVYAMQVALTNTMATPYLTSALVTIPSGSLAVKCSPIKTHHFTLQAFTTILETYHFYFAAAGEFDQYPIHLADRKNNIIASSPAFKLVVVETIEKSMLMDLQGGITWSYVSEHGTDDEVLDWLKSEENAVSGEIILDIIERLEKNAGLWLKVVDLLRLRGCYCREAWALSVKHGSEEHLIQWLFSEKARDLSYLKAGDRERDDFVEGNQDIYSYWPLINARAHEIGQKSRANNREFIETYSKFLLYLLVKPVARHTCRDHISLICYLLLQDRFSEALVRFNHLKEEIASNRVQLDMEIQMDYLAAWFDFIDQSALVGSASLQTARSVGIKYKDYPVKHWNELFASILARVNEFDEFYSEATSNDGTSTGPQATKSELSAEPSLTFSILSGDSGALGSLRFAYSNLRRCDVRFYALNLEMEFSSRPFAIASRFKGTGSVTSGDSTTLMTQPHQTMVVEFPVGSGELTVPVPTSIKRGNVAVESFALNGTISQIRVASETSLKVLFMERKGILQVLKGDDSKTKSEGPADEWALASAMNDSTDVRLLASRHFKPVGSVYVKTYAKLNDGREVFYKDGYSDILGRFEYVSLSNTEILAKVELFAVLVSSEEYGDAVFTAKPPKV